MDETAHFMDETAHFMDENVTFQSYGSKGHFMDETAKLMEKKDTSQIVLIPTFPEFPVLHIVFVPTIFVQALYTVKSGALVILL